MDYINIDENDVRDVDEVVEPIEPVEAEIVQENTKGNSLDLYGILYALGAFVLGCYSFFSAFFIEYSFILCFLATIGSCILGFKYLKGSYKKSFLKYGALIGFLLGILGIPLGVVRICLAVVASFGTAVLRVLF